MRSSGVVTIRKATRCGLQLKGHSIADPTDRVWPIGVWIPRKGLWVSKLTLRADDGELINDARMWCDSMPSCVMSSSTPHGESEP